MSQAGPIDFSAFAAMYRTLRQADRRWDVAFGKPAAPGWIDGQAFKDACSGPFHALLLRLGVSSQTSNRKTIAGSFALRFGWASAAVIGPSLRYKCVPDVALENLSLEFSPAAVLERVALHEPRGVVVADGSGAAAGGGTVADGTALVTELRRALVGHSAPVVAALHQWSGFAPIATWGLLTSCWAAQVTALAAPGDDQRALLPILDGLFSGDDVIGRMRPRVYALTHGSAAHLFHRRASCCRWYLLPDGELCTSCPLLSDEDRQRRNRAAMAQQLGWQSQRLALRRRGEC